MTLRIVSGLASDVIAQGMQTRPLAIDQRILRAKGKIREAHIPYEIPSRVDMPHRLDSVLNVISLIFDEGYTVAASEAPARARLSSEAIRLGRMLVELLPEPEAISLLALMLLRESRRTARTSSLGEFIPLTDQDRNLWNRDLILEGVILVDQALLSHRFGPYTLQAAIETLHAEAPSSTATDWPQVVGLYDVLLRADPSPQVERDRAAAVALRDGPAAGLALIDAILDRGDLEEDHLVYWVRADLCRRLGRTVEARVAYLQALSLTHQDAERRYLERRVNELPI